MFREKFPPEDFNLFNPQLKVQQAQESTFRVCSPKCKN